MRKLLSGTKLENGRDKGRASRESSKDVEKRLVQLFAAEENHKANQIEKKKSWG